MGRRTGSDSRVALRGAMPSPVVTRDEDRYQGRREHRTSRLPVLDPGAAESPRQELLLSVYREVCASWRLLTEVRFKLLALLPPIAGLALVGILSSAGPFEGLRDSARVGLALFGLLVTAGLYLYDRRNNTLYDDLASRARRAEYELGIHTGAFLGRVSPVSKGLTPARLVRHGVATGLVYWTVLLAWMAAIVLVLVER